MKPLLFKHVKKTLGRLQSLSFEKMVSYNFCPTLRDSSRIILLLKVCGDGQEGSYECYRQDWYFYASLVAGNFKISEIYNANKLFSRTRQLFMSSELKNRSLCNARKIKIHIFDRKIVFKFQFCCLFLVPSSYLFVLVESEF